MAREELKWQNIDADDLPADVKQSFDAMVTAEAAFKADLDKLLKRKVMPEDKFLLIARKGKSLGVAYVSTPASPAPRPIAKAGQPGAGANRGKANGVVWCAHESRDHHRPAHTRAEDALATPFRGSHLRTSARARRRTSARCRLHTPKGEALAISVPRGETAVSEHFQARMPHGLFVPDVQ
jgi:hypothetical protein